MSKIIEQAHDLVPGTPHLLGTTATADGQRIEIPAAMQNVFCTFQARGEDVFIRFGDDTVDVDEATVSTVTSEVLSGGAKAPHLHIPAGSEKHRRLPAGLFTHFAHISAATGGFLHFGPATGTGLDDDA